MHAHKFFFIPLLVAILLSAPCAAQKLTFSTQEFIPFSYSIDGMAAGPAVEVVKQICATMKVECSIEVHPWLRSLHLAKTGQVNGIFVVGKNTEREKWLYFTPPIFTTAYGFFVRGDNPLQYAKPADVRGYTVGAHGPSNTSHSLEKIAHQLNGQLGIDIQPETEQVFQKLAHGRLDAVYSNRDVGKALIHRLGFTNIRYAGSQRTLNYYIAFSQKSTDKAVVEQFNATIRKLFAQGILPQLIQARMLEPAQ